MRGQWLPRPRSLAKTFALFVRVCVYHNIRVHASISKCVCVYKKKQQSNKTRTMRRWTVFPPNGQQYHHIHSHRRHLPRLFTVVVVGRVVCEPRGRRE